MDRKSFLIKIGAAFLAGIPLVSLWSCSDNSEDDDMDDNAEDDEEIDDESDEDDTDDSDDTSTSCVDNGTSSSISANHGHSLTVSKEDMAAGTAKTYSITGSADHAHDVTVTAENFTSLQSNSSVTIQSTTSGHSHSVTITCA
ncbi:MAG: hypothetical protein ABJH98_03830 [Reichenbachiella sp.]|uniref:hypothetical protein n=1 Tax=Reichenbachiella sp. TaxID=2184521 RepID=UPI00329A2451